MDSVLKYLARELFDPKFREYNPHRVFPSCLQVYSDFKNRDHV